MFDQNRLGTIEKDIFYTTENDPFRSLDVYYPATISDKPWPVVVNIHGGAWSMGTKDWAWYSADLAKLGILGVSINYRLSPTVQAPVHVEDSKCAIRFLRANADRFNLDQNRIGVMGHSAGGHLAALIALTGGLGIFNDKGGWECYSDEVQVAVPCSGPFSMVNFLQFDQELCLAVFGNLEQSNPMLREYSPATYVSENEPPFLLVHGSADDVVPVESSMELHNALLHFDNESELLIVEGGNHGFEVEGISQDHVIKKKIIPFLVKYLK